METLYKNQMNDFLNNFNTLNKIGQNIKNYIKVMKIISLSEESSKTNRTFYNMTNYAFIFARAGSKRIKNKILYCLILNH